MERGGACNQAQGQMGLDRQGRVRTWSLSLTVTSLSCNDMQAATLHKLKMTVDCDRSAHGGSGPGSGCSAPERSGSGVAVWKP
eukprot:1972744-Rhodomonas_salina.1